MPPASLDEVERAVRAGDIDRAATLAADAARAGLRHPLVFNLLAHVAEQRFDYAAAAKHLQDGLRLDPRDPSLLTSLGMCLAKLERRPEAVAAFKTALDLAPDFPGALNVLAENLTALGHSEAALGRSEEHTSELQSH